VNLWEVRIDTRAIDGWAAFHRAFAEMFRFPADYGATRDDWVACMGELDDPGHPLFREHPQASQGAVLRVDNADELARRLPDVYRALVEWPAYLNWVRLESGFTPYLALAFDDRPRRVAAHHAALNAAEPQSAPDTSR
jgi:hypothetical protein